jgi:glutathione S-transferase
LARFNHLPLVGLSATILLPLVWLFARRSRADDRTVREDLRQLDARLQRVDDWIDEGILGSESPNAADFQIAPSLRLLLAFEDLAPAFTGRPARDLAQRYLSPSPVRIASVFPRPWLGRERSMRDA